MSGEALREALEHYACPGLGKCSRPRLKDGTCVAMATDGMCGEVARAALAAAGPAQDEYARGLEDAARAAETWMRGGSSIGSAIADAIRALKPLPAPPVQP